MSHSMAKGMSPFRNQYILTRLAFPSWPDWKSTVAGEFTLHTHPELPVAAHRSGADVIILVGHCYDFRDPLADNHAIVSSLNPGKDLLAFHQQVQYLAGAYFFIHCRGNVVTVIPDLAALREVYISRDANDETILASSPQLIAHLQPLVPDANEFYTSPRFTARKIWVGDSTSYAGITRLKPNHQVTLPTGDVTRFFPNEALASQTIDEVVEKTHNVLPGFIKSVYHRHPKLMIGLTAGWDSRLLLAASKDIHKDLTFFINRHSLDNAFDYDIPYRLAHALNLTFIQIQFSNPDATPDHAVFQELPHVTKASYLSIMGFERIFAGYTTVSGNVSEIARNFFGIIKNLNGAKLAALVKYPGEKYCIDTYQAWLNTHEALFQALGYQTLDMFYWEESMANRLPKSISEAQAMGRFILPAFNCRFLMTQFLTVDKKLRDVQHNALYMKLMERTWSDVLQQPINPSLKKSVIRMMQKTGVYNAYRNLFTTGIFRAK